MTTLQGMTWNHPRGIDPLVACAAAFERERGVRVEWAARSLEDFEAFPLDELAAQYDLLVIDHPHVGMAAASGCLLPLDENVSPPALEAFTNETVGRSFETYHYRGHQWAVAIDTAAQVAAWREGALASPPQSWAEVIDLAAAGNVVWPLAHVHALMSFFTLCANRGHPCDTSPGEPLINLGEGAAVLMELRRLAERVSPDCFSMNPVGAYEAMAGGDDGPIYCPLIYGYVSYGAAAFRPRRMCFGDIPGFVPGQVRGSTLGGTGLAVSARAASREDAIAFALFAASAATQKGLYANSGGQPAHRAAWAHPPLNHAANGFYRNTLATLDRAYIRPRFDGYIHFQHQAGQAVVACLKGECSPEATIHQLNEWLLSYERANES
ncbi:MAG TPA: hypothetical protein VGB55_15825 [Tepidisphaeraceae bacterium]